MTSHSRHERHMHNTPTRKDDDMSTSENHDSPRLTTTLSGGTR